MGWFVSLLVIAILIAFNVFAADTMVRLRRDIKEIHKAVVKAPAAPFVAANACVSNPDPSANPAITPSFAT